MVPQAPPLRASYAARAAAISRWCASVQVTGERMVETFRAALPVPVAAVGAVRRRA
ncbi:hypothetical protein ACIHEI_26485 [Kitasatospora sp. NPDC051984]|uniref:hypothetical protein n=1 Tax=Kitasatospora sp. NPDC051984 TaxID=3364059 RepID=UPI0037C96F22